MMLCYIILCYVTPSYIKLQYITYSVLEGVCLGCCVIKDSPSQCHHNLTQEVIAAKHVAVPH